VWPDNILLRTGYINWFWNIKSNLGAQNKMETSSIAEVRYSSELLARYIYVN